MTCEELLRMLNDYVDGDIDPSICEHFDGHLADCQPCQVVVDTIQKTVTLYKDEARYELPIPFRDRLHAALREKWKQTHTDPDDRPADESSSTP
jgi:anti-sigma factor RsiW